jgi:hypothetical protein
MTPKEKILELVKNKPKHFGILIKKDPILWNWVQENSKITANQDSISAKIYSAINEVSDVCERGNIKKYTRWSEGFANCGPAAICECTRNRLTQACMLAQKSKTQEQKEHTENKRCQTMIKKFGVAYSFQRPEVKAKISAPKIDPAIFNKLIDKDWMYQEYVVNKRSAADLANELGVYYSTVLDYCNQHDFTIRRTSGYSVEEKQISNYLSELGIHHETSDWSVLKKLELDIFVPNKNFAIEMNGLRWHAFNPNFKNPDGLKLEDSERHIQKTKFAQDRGVTLFHVTDWEWNNKQDIIKAQLKSKFGLNKKIYARNCKLKEVSSKDAREFLDKFHLQGFIGSKFYIGLYYADELVMILSAGRHRFDKKFDGVEIHRICSRSDITVVGGGSKLVSYLKKNINGTIETYCDIQKSTGAGYLAMGFTLKDISKPGYFWTDTKHIIPRWKASRTELKKWLINYDPLKEEHENMWNNKYARYYDCGNYVFRI